MFNKDNRQIKTILIAQLIIILNKIKVNAYIKVKNKNSKIAIMTM